MNFAPIPANRALVPVRPATSFTKNAFLNFAGGVAFGFATALLIQHAGFSSGKEVAAANEHGPTPQTRVFATVEPQIASPSQAPKSANTVAATPKTVDVTGSVNQSIKEDQSQYAHADQSNHGVASAQKPRKHHWGRYRYPWAAGPYPWPPTAFEMHIYRGW
jgi:hypothetical protein